MYCFINEYVRVHRAKMSFSFYFYLFSFFSASRDSLALGLIQQGSGKENGIENSLSLRQSYDQCETNIFEDKSNGLSLCAAIGQWP